ncbi:DUF547 domain-containing protein [bacterium]|nr:DUF547 domain-containing protein [bacterium]
MKMRSFLGGMRFSVLLLVIGLVSLTALTIFWIRVDGANKEDTAISDFQPGQDDFDHTFSRYQMLVNTVVVPVSPLGAGVHYKRAKELRKDREEIRANLERVSRAQFDSWSNNQQLAFLINAYNFMTIELVIKHYPVRSIKDIGTFFVGPWKQKFFTLFGDVRDLDFIEHGLIREMFLEPRIHFALVCASRGCPSLQKEVYVAEKLDEQLDFATRQFLQDKAHNRIDHEGKKLFLSKIFSWYEDDFLLFSDSLQEFALRYMGDNSLKSPGAAALNYRVVYSEYDWALNDVQQ